MIDREPKVGRYLFVESMLRDGFFRRAGVITKISGRRIYYDDHRDSPVTTERFIHERSVTAVCDTADEIDALLEFNRRALAEVNELKDRHAAEAKAFFSRETVTR